MIRFIPAFLSVFLTCYGLSPAIAQTPAIAAFTPLKATVSSEITITGTNFSSDTLVTRVFFGSIRARLTYASPTSLKVLVPAGIRYSQITVLNTSTGLSGSSSRYFQPIFTSSPSTISGSEFKSVEVGSPEAWQTYIEDADGDGKPDILTGNAAPGVGALYIKLNSSTPGTISFKGGISKQGMLRALRLADLDGDGKPELVVIPTEKLAVRVFHNTSTPGNLSFGAMTEYPTDSNNMQFGDIDGDGRPDIVLGGNPYFLSNTSTPGTVMLEPRSFSSPGLKNSRLADIDGDNKPEIIGSNTTGLSVLPNISTPGNLGFGAELRFEGTGTISSLQIADINDDGKNDVYSQNSTGSYSFFKNTSTGPAISFERTDLLFPAGDRKVSGSTLADMNGDGKLDLVYNYTKRGIGDIKILKNASTGNTISFEETPVALFVDEYATPINVNDLDLDGIPDIVSTGGLIYLGVYRYIPALSVLPKISSFSPSSADSGDTVTISGTNFTNVTSVEFGGTPAASFTILSPTMIRAVVTGARSGEVTVTDHKGRSSKSGFVFLPEPRIHSFSPRTAIAGSTIQIKGRNFTGTSSVLIGTVAASAFTVQSDSTITAIINEPASGNITVVTPKGRGELGWFTSIPVTAISAGGPTTFARGDSVILTANTGKQYLYRWFRNGDEIQGANRNTYTVTKSGTYKAAIAFDSVSSVSNQIDVKTILVLPANTFVLKVSAETCRNNNDGSISIKTAAQSWTYNAQVTGDSFNKQYTFATTLNIQDLPSGKYNLCITVPDDPEYQQCYEIIISEPKDLQVYSSVNDNTDIINLQMTGGSTYFIELNGTKYQTTADSISLKLKRGQNWLTVYTDKLCQGQVSKVITLGASLAYPNPFDNILYIPSGNENSAEIEVWSSTGKMVHRSKQQSQNGIFSLELPGLQSGVYMLKLNSRQTETFYKVVKR